MGCADFLREGATTNFGSIPGKTVDRSLQALCDVDRARAKEEVLKRVQIEKFRSVALKVSASVTGDEVSDLTQIEQTRRQSDDDSWEIARARGELISEIYTGAIIRAGFSP